MKDKKMLYGIGIVFLFIASVGFSYAYFTASIANKDVKDQVVTTGTLELTYTDGAEIKMLNIKPGQTITKKVTVKNTGTLDTSYNLVWQELNNTITNNEMIMSVTCKRFNGEVEEETCEGVDETPIKENVIKDKISIEPGITHEYNVTITFKETNAAQNYNQGKSFSGILGVDEYKPTQFEQDSWSTIISNVKAGNISKYNVGDTKEVDLGTTYGTHTLRIANTSTPSECGTEGFSQTACGFVLEFADIITTHTMNDSEPGTCVGGWPATILRTFVNNDIYNSLSSDLKNEIIDTTVVSNHGSYDSSNFISTDKLYLFAPTEIYSDWKSNYNSSYDTARDLTRQLDYYKKEGVTLYSYSKAGKTYNSTVSWWWLRSTYTRINNSYFIGVANGGGFSYTGAITASGVSPALRIG